MVWRSRRLSGGRWTRSQRIPVDVRRTTLIVRDMDRSLAFWRDAIDLTVVYDRVLGQAPRQQRLVLLRANDEFIGNVGLLERFDTKADMPPVVYERARYGHVIFVVNAKDLEERLEKVKRVAGVRIHSGQGWRPVLGNQRSSSRVNQPKSAGINSWISASPAQR